MAKPFRALELHYPMIPLSETDELFLFNPNQTMHGGFWGQLQFNFEYLQNRQSYDRKIRWIS